METTFFWIGAQILMQFWLESETDSKAVCKGDA